jgi:alpha-1,3-mannosyltransferase
MEQGTAPRFDTTEIGPVRVRGLDYQAALSTVAAMLDSPDKQVVAFCNAHTVNLSRRDARFRHALDRALVLNDGVGVDLARRVLYGTPFPDNLNGTDFTPALLGTVRRPLRLFLLGSRPGVAERAADVLAERFPGHRIVGTRDGFFDPSEGAAVADAIARSRADLVLVGMGQPRQELWAVEHGQATGAVVMCVGAYLDFVAGVVRRAPDWVRKGRLEWLFRLASEPGRLAGRYLIGNPRFAGGVLIDRFVRDPQR